MEEKTVLATVTWCRRFGRSPFEPPRKNFGACLAPETSHGEIQSDLLFAQRNIRPGLASSPGQDTPCFESEVEVQAREVKKDVGGEVVRIAGGEDDYWRQAYARAVLAAIEYLNLLTWTLILAARSIQLYSIEPLQAYSTTCPFRPLLHMSYPSLFSM